MEQTYRVISHRVVKQYAEACGRYANGSLKWRWVSHKGTATKHSYVDAQDIRDTERAMGHNVRMETVNETPVQGSLAFAD